MRYISDDNQVFETEQECIEHEKMVREEREKKNRLEAEKKNRIEEINNASKNLSELIRKFNEDYKEPVKMNGLNDFWTSFLGF